MPKSDRSTVYVYLLAIQSQFLLYCQVLRRKSFIHFYEVDVIKRETSLLQGKFRRRYRATSHQFWIHSRNAPTDNSPEWLQIPFLGRLEGHHHDCCTTVHYAAGIASSHCSVFAECRL